MAKKLSRLIYLGVSATAGLSPPAAGTTGDFTKVRRVLNATEAMATSEIDDSDYDDGADDSFVPGTRNGRNTISLNFDPADAGYQLLELMRESNSVGTFLFRTENAAGEDEWAQDAFVVQLDHASGGRQSMQTKSLGIRLTGPRRRAKVAQVL